MSFDEMQNTYGGFFGPVLFTVWVVKGLVGHCLATGVAIVLATGAAVA